MAEVSPSVEQAIQRILLKATPIRIEDGDIYLSTYPYHCEPFLRYVENGRHITVDCYREFIGEPWYYWLSTIARNLFTPRKYVVEIPHPICWDNENIPISDEKAKEITSRIEQAVSRNYRRYRIEIAGTKNVYDIRYAP